MLKILYSSFFIIRIFMLIACMSSFFFVLLHDKVQLSFIIYNFQFEKWLTTY